MRTYDKEYMASIYDLAKNKLGIETVVFTTDGDTQEKQDCGDFVPLALAAVDFASERDVSQLFDMIRRVNGYRGPIINSEYYPGWFDTWGDGHHTVD